MNKPFLAAACGLFLVAAQLPALAQTKVTTVQPSTTGSTRTATTAVATTASSTGNQPKQPLPGCQPSGNQPKKCRPSGS